MHVYLYYCMWQLICTHYTQFINRTGLLVMNTHYAAEITVPSSQLIMMQCPYNLWWITLVLFHNSRELYTSYRRLIFWMKMSTCARFHSENFYFIYYIYCILCKLIPKLYVMYTNYGSFLCTKFPILPSFCRDMRLWYIFLCFDKSLTESLTVLASIPANTLTVLASIPANTFDLDHLPPSCPSSFDCSCRSSQTGRQNIGHTCMCTLVVLYDNYKLFSA